MSGDRLVPLSSEWGAAKERDCSNVYDSTSTFANRELVDKVKEEMVLLNNSFSVFTVDPTFVYIDLFRQSDQCCNCKINC